jgi:hypothetical protein
MGLPAQRLRSVSDRKRCDIAPDHSLASLVAKLIAAAFVARWCAGSAVEITDGAFRVREDQPARRIAAGPHFLSLTRPRRFAPRSYLPRGVTADNSDRYDRDAAVDDQRLFTGDLRRASLADQCA